MISRNFLLFFHLQINVAVTMTFDCLVVRIKPSIEEQLH